MKYRKPLSGLLITGLLAATTPVAAATEPDPVDRTVADLVRDGFPAGVTALRDDDRMRHYAHGVADTATGEPAETGDRFRIASNTKAFVAVVVLQLVGEGRLSLDDTVEQRLPGLIRGPGYDASAITVRQLLNHTSGLHDPLDPHFFDPYLVDGDRGYVYPPREVIRRSLLDPPERGVHYSNTNYLVLGLLIERVTGEHLGHQLRARILDPLGMRDTSFPVLDPYLHGPHLHGYDLAGEDMTVFSPSYDWAAGAMVSTVDDLQRFHRALFGGELLAPEQQRAMFEAVPSSEFEAYGLGVERLTLPCPDGPREVWGDTGAGPGYYSLAFTRGTRTVVTVLTSYDLAAELRGDQPFPASPLPALTAAFCTT